MPAWPSVKFSMCAVPTLVTTPQSGAAMRPARQFRRDGSCPFRPRQIRARARGAAIAAAVRKALLRLPCDLSTLNFAPSAAAMASLVVVLPAEPVMATTRLPHWRRTCEASACSAMQRIFGDQQRNGQRRIGQRGDSCARDDRGNGSALNGGGDEVVAVEALAAHREEQLARRDGARVNGVARARRSAPACEMLDGASSTAPAPMAASASVSFIDSPP